VLWSPAGNLIYVANAGADNVAIVDGAANRLVGRYATGDRPWALCRSPDRNRVYVANRQSGTVSVFRERTP
jgi:YVTN family beta-propeller protein